jgi:hypothetical protein
MFRVRKALTFLAILVTPLYAQWSSGGVTGNPKQTLGAEFDTTYVEGLLTADTLSATTLFGEGSNITGINSSPTVTSTISYPDCTKTTYSARKVICGSDYNPYWMHDLDLFRAEQADNSYVASDGYWPDEWCVTISEGQDTVAVWDRRTMTTPWQVYKQGGTTNGDRAVLPTSSKATSLHRLDGMLYIGINDPGWGAALADYRSDIIDATYTQDIYRFNGTISQRNSALGVRNTENGLGVVADEINAVSAIRDPFGLKDGDWPAQWWIVGTDNQASLYNPHANAIYDENYWTGTNDNDWLTLLSGGGLFIDGSTSAPTESAVAWNRSILDVTADGWQHDELWYSSASGSEDLAWPNAAIPTGGTVIEHGSIENAPYALLASDHGLYGLQTKPSDNDAGIKVRFHDDYQGPAEVGDVRGAWPLHAVTDVSPKGYDLTNNNSVTFSNGGPAGSYANFDGANTYLNDIAESGYNAGTTDFSVACWFRSSSASNPGSTEFIWYLDDGTPTDYITLYITTSGYPYFQISDDGGSSSDSVNPSVDIYDGNWHYLVAQRNNGTWEVWMDGELIGSTAVSAAAAALSVDDLHIGSNDSGASVLDGDIGGFVYSGTAMTAGQFRDIYRAGIAMLNAPLTDETLPDSNVVAVATIPGGGNWVATADTDSVKVWSKVGPHLIPHSVYGAPGDKIRDVAIWAMADSFGLAIADSTAFRVIQPDPVVTDLAQARRYPFTQPVVGVPTIVDSAGRDGIFWTINDAIEATYNASGPKQSGRILFKEGTYPPFDATRSNQVIEGVGYSSYVNGGTTGDAVDVTGDRITFRNFSAETTAGQGNAYDVFHFASGAQFNVIDGVRIRNSDDSCIAIDSGADWGLVVNSELVDCDNYGIFNLGGRWRAIGNQQRGGTYGFSASNSGYSVYIGNMFTGLASSAILFNNSSSTEHNIAIGNSSTTQLEITNNQSTDNIIVGNSTNGAGVTNNGTSSTVANNE